MQPKTRWLVLVGLTVALAMMLILSVVDLVARRGDGTDVAMRVAMLCLAASQLTLMDHHGFQIVGVERDRLVVFGGLGLVASLATLSWAVMASETLSRIIALLVAFAVAVATLSELRRQRRNLKGPR